MRVLRKEWKNKRSGFSRRVRWYDNDERSFRLDLEDEYYQVNRFFTERAEAQRLWDAFVKAGASDIPAVIDGHLISVVKLACKVCSIKIPGYEETKTLEQVLADYERTQEFQSASKWLTQHTPEALLLDGLA